MKAAVAALVLAVFPVAALAQSSPASSAAAEPGFHAQLYQRYCDKLREGPEAYVAFVKRLKTVHGYTFEEFAPREPTDEVRAVCRDVNARMAQGATPAKR